MRLLQAARLSRLGDASTGLDKQDETAQRHAELNDHAIVGVAEDTDVSGDTDPWARPQLGPWLSDPAKVARYDGIIASHVDRLARSTIHFMRLLQWADDTCGKCPKGKVRPEHVKRIITTGENAVDFSSPVGKLLGYIISWLGEQELAAITRRNRETQAWLKENDFLVGRPPFGYRVSCTHCGEVKCQCGPKCPHHKTLVPVDALRRYVAGMFERYLAGESLTAICEWLDSEAVKPSSGGIWSQKSVGQILRNPVYTGRRMNANGDTDLKVEPIVSSSLAKQVIAKLDSASRKRGAASGDTAMLTNVAFCGKCHGPMYRIKVPRKTGPEIFYRCAGTARNPSTCKNMIPLAKLDAYMERKMTNAPLGTEADVRFAFIEGRNHDDEMEEIEKNIQRLSLRDPEYRAKRDALEAEWERLDSDTDVIPSRTEPQETGKTVAEVWISLDQAGKRQYLLDRDARLEVAEGRARLHIAGAWKAAGPIEDEAA